MTRGVARYLVGSLVVLGLAACGKSWLAERDAWRHEAEVACLKSGQVKETPTLVRIQPITGPGVCGADYPIRVSALGDGNAIGFADDLRPPGSVPVTRQPLANPPPAQTYSPYQAHPAQQPPQYQPYRAQPQAYPPQAYPPQAAPASTSAPMSIYAPGVAQPEPDGEEDFEPAEQGVQSAPRPPRPGAPQAYPQQRYPAQPYPAQPAEQVPLGRDRTPVTTGAVAVQPAATLACPIVSALDTWLAGGVQPAAMRWFGVPVAEIKQISAYSCRGRVGDGTSKISEHAFGNALDIAAFVLADGRKISVKEGWRGLPEEQAFLRDIQADACRLFTTVLAPGSNAFHYDHIHVDLRRRGRGGRDGAICNPRPVSGQEIAARARPGRHSAEITGSTTRNWRLPEFLRRGTSRNETPAAVPGDDGADD
jgi:hypothetical protein